MSVPAAVTEPASFLSVEGCSTCQRSLVRSVYAAYLFSNTYCILRAYRILCMMAYQFGDLRWHMELIYQVLIEVVSNLLRVLGQYSDAVNLVCIGVVAVSRIYGSLCILTYIKR
jgi:hypothetical protein